MLRALDTVEDDMEAYKGQQTGYGKQMNTDYQAPSEFTLETLKSPSSHKFQ